MKTRLLTLSVVLLAVVATAWAAPVLTPVDALDQPPADRWTGWGEETLALTDIDARIVSWGRDEGQRDRVVFTLPVPASGLEAWEGRALVEIPGQMSRLLERDEDGSTSWTEVDANWHLPNVEINGEPYRVLVDPDFYLLVYSAPGPGAIQGLLTFEDTIGRADLWDFEDDRAVLANDDGLHVVNLSSPMVPVIQSTITPPVAGWIATDVEIQGDILAVRWGNRFQLWDISDALSPDLLDEAVTDDRYLALGDRWLATWDESGTLVTVWDAQDPGVVSVRGSFEADAAPEGPWAIRIDGDSLLVLTTSGLARVRIPAGTATITSDGPAWPVLEARTMATAGRAAWLQGSRDRLMIDLSGLRLAGIQQDVPPCNALLPAGDVLYHNIGGQELRIESLSDPLDPQAIAVLDEPQPQHVDVSGDLLAVVDMAGLTLFDVGDPAAPVQRGELAVEGTPHRVLLVDQTAVVITYDEMESGRVHVVDVSDVMQPDPVASYEVDPEGDGATWWAQRLIRRGSSALVMCVRSSMIGPPVVRTMTVDLTDPATPQTSYTDGETDVWCYGPGPYDPRVVQGDLPVQIGDLHVSFDIDTVTVYRALTGPTDLEPVTSWMTPGDPVETIAAVGNLLLVVSGHRLDVLTLSDDDVVPAPDAPAALVVRAAPNPFNPLTEFRFTMVVGGRAEVEIIDPRGRRVRTLSADVPAGGAVMRWDGTDDRGRAAPSGTYLLRVSTPSGAAVGRCQLVR